MRPRPLGVLSLICLALTSLWLVLLIVSRATYGLETLEQVLAYITRAPVLFYSTYTNAALFTVSTVMLFVALYQYCKPTAPQWAAIGVAFVPIYGALNLVAYCSQITVVPRLLRLRADLEYRDLAQLLLTQTVQESPDSAVFMVNNLAYAVLGVPSMVFGVLMLRSDPTLRLGGSLLALNGVACIVGLIGVAAQSAWLSLGSGVGGVLFLLALVSMSRAFLRRRPERLRSVCIQGR